MFIHSLLLRSVNIFMTDTLNSLSGKLLIFVSLKSFSGDFLCSLVWNQSLSLLTFAYLCVFVSNRQNEEVVLLDVSHDSEIKSP